MKKILFTLLLFAMTLMASAQEPTLKARSIYDVNQDDMVNISDIPTLSNKLLGKAEDKTVVDTQSLLDVLSTLTKQYEKILTELADLKAKKCNCNCSCEGISDNPNLIKGTFSISSTKKVQFTKGNLYWDGSAYHFEANQTDYPELWNPSHVGHFYWTSLKDYQSGNTNYMPYAENYSYSSQSTIDKFFCGEDNPLTIEGENGYFALSIDDWEYLIKTRSNASNLHKYGVTVNGKANCLIIAPDTFSGSLKSYYTLDEINSLGLVCLPAAGTRNGSIFNFTNSGNYFSSTHNPFGSNSTYILYFTSDDVETLNHGRSIGRNLRLVRLPQ